MSKSDNDMKVEFLRANTFRGKKYKKGQKAVLPDGVAFKLIAVSLAKRV